MGELQLLWGVLKLSAVEMGVAVGGRSTLESHSHKEAVQALRVGDQHQHYPLLEEPSVDTH